MTDLPDRARKFIPGGVSSPARAFGAVGGDPIFADHGEGAYLVDTHGDRYVDYIQGFGAVILGHADPRVADAIATAAKRSGAVGLSTEAEVRLAELVVERVPTAERARFVTSGTEASMTAARIARAATERSVIVKFEGCYHGHADGFLAKAGSGVATFAIPMAAGVPDESTDTTRVLPFNDIGQVGNFFELHGSSVAAVFVEPIAANMGTVLPEPGFLASIIEGCAAHGALTVFDEVVTGFRVGPGGAQEAFELEPDLTMLGKVLGGGLPIGAVAGRADLMDRLSPVGDVYQAGTYAAHPHAMAAGVATLEALTSEDYASLEATATLLSDGLSAAAKDAGVEATVVRAGTFLTVFFASDAPKNFDDSNAIDRDAFARFHRSLRDNGVLIPPSPFEAWFPSLAHGDREVEATIDAASAAFAAAKG
jgi:glutamate-1-semialdehyde 2,1-aminomutase